MAALVSSWSQGPLIAAGSSATVHRGSVTFSDGTSVPVAIKSSPVACCVPLLREEKIFNALRNVPNILQCVATCTSYDRETREHVHRLFLELSPCGSLLDAINRNLSSSQSRGGRCALPEDQIRSYALCVLVGLYHMHVRGYVHCDIKPDNILVWDDYEAKIADFGWAKRAAGEEEEEGDEKEKMRRGTERYMAPESLLRAEYGPGVDVWALGCTVIEMASGRPVWEFPEERCRKAAGMVPRVPEGLSEEGRDFLSKCLARDPRDRWTAEMLLSHPFLLGKSEVEEEEEPWFRDDGLIVYGDELV